MKIFLYLITGFLFLCQFSYPNHPNVTGGQLLYLLASPTVIGNGGSYATETRELDALPLNPVIAADRLYQNVNVSYLSGENGEIGGYSLSYTLPTVIGVFSLAHTGFDYGEYNLDQFFNTQILFSKVITTRIKFGFGLNIDYFSQAKEYPLGISLDVSVLYESEKTLESTFGLGGLKIGALVKHLGLPNVVTNANGEEGWLKPTELRAGVGFNMVNLSYSRARHLIGLSADLGVSYPLNMIGNLALKNRIIFPRGMVNSMQINIGTFIGDDSSFGYHDLIPFTFGFILKVNIDKTLINLNYAFVPERINNSMGLFQTFSLNLSFGKKDFDKPKINIGKDADEKKVPRGSLPESF